MTNLVLAVNLYPLPKSSSQSHSEVDLTHPANGNFDGPQIQQWDTNKHSGDSHATRSDGSRSSSWWRNMSTRRVPWDPKNGDIDGRGPYKETTVNTASPNLEMATSSPTHHSPGRRTTSGKIKSFFKRRPRHEEHEKQLSSFGSSSQLRTPPTSDPGRSLNSDD
jgi:hypothetical protein